jgi:hypothetical protein
MKKLALLLVLASCSLMMASTNGAMLIGAGKVQVNGTATSGTYTVFPGDQIQTAADSSAMVKSPVAVVSIASESAIQYQGNSVTFEHGSVTVTAPKGADAHFGKLVISANPAHPARFQMVSLNGVDRIAALEGSLSITDGIHKTTLDAGYMMTTVAEPPASPSSPSSNRKAPAAQVGIPGWAIVTITAGALGGVLGGLAVSGAFTSATSPH